MNEIKELISKTTQPAMPMPKTTKIEVIISPLSEKLLYNSTSKEQAKANRLCIIETTPYLIHFSLFTGTVFNKKSIILIYIFLLYFHYNIEYCKTKTFSCMFLVKKNLLFF